MKILSPAQTEIMLAIWEAGKPLKRSELQELLTEREYGTGPQGFLAEAFQLLPLFHSCLALLSQDR